MADIYTAKGLREKRAHLATEMRSLVEIVGKEDRDFSSEEQTKFDNLECEIGNFGEAPTGLAARIQSIEKCDALDKEMSSHSNRQERHDYEANYKTADPSKITSRDQKLAFRAWAMGGTMHPVNDRCQEAAQKCGVNVNAESFRMNLYPEAPKTMADITRMHEAASLGELEMRTTGYQGIGDSTLGGNLTQNETIRQIEVALKAFGGVRDVATIIRTQTGSDMPWPTVNDTTEVGAILAEHAAADAQQMVFGTNTLSAYQYTSGLIRVSRQLMQDEAVGLEQLIGEAIGTRLARGTAAHFTVGTGSSQASGIVTTAPEGSTGSAVNTITYAEIVELQHSVDPAYRSSPSARFMLNDSTLKAVKKLLDGDSRPLWSAGFSSQDPDSILGVPYIINQNMASLAATTTDGAAKVMIYGAMDRYKIREVREIEVKRLVERYAEKAQVGFVGFGRWDGLTIQASTVTAPIFHFVTKTT